MKRILLFLLLSTFSFSQAEDWIYYYNPYDIGRLRPDGSGNELFHSLNVPLMHRITDISLDKSKLLYVQGGDHGEAVSIDIESMDMQMSEMNGEFGECPWCDFYYPEKARFTYDDNYIVFEDDQNLYKYSFIDSTLILLIEGEEEWGEGGLKKISMSPDKQKIAYLGYDSDSTRVIVFNLQSNESTVIEAFPILVDSCIPTGQIFWASDNNIFFTMCDTITQSQLFKLHISNGDAAQLIENDIHNILETHDSVLEKLVYTKMMADSLEYWMVDLESNELLKLDIMNYEYQGYSIMWHHQAWSPDKSKVILNGMYTPPGLHIYNTFTDSLITIFVDNQDYQIFNTMFWVGDNIEYNEPVWFVSTAGSDENGNGSEESPFSTIQKAVNVASNGDTILVMNGLYIENIDWSTTNNIRLIGSHIDSTIIDGGNNGKVIDNSDETSHPIEISKLTIQNGISTGRGGGISLKMVGDLLLKNIRVNNNHAQIGGGIYIEGEGSESFIPTVVHFENAIISNNSAENYGGGVSLSGDVISSIIKNVTVVNNFATNGGGGLQAGSIGDYAVIANSIFWNNQPSNVDGMVFPYYSNIDIPVGSNNIYTDPLFVNDSTNFNLLDGSPCIDGGTEFLVVDLSTYMLPGTVPDTIININDEDYYGLAPDMGAIEYQSILHLDRDLLPKQYILHQNYPNPFNPITSLRYDLPEDGLVNITIYDMMGRIVKLLVNSPQTAGFKSIRWNATNDRNEPVSAGLYLYAIQAGKFRQTKKMVLLK